MIRIAWGIIVSLKKMLASYLDIIFSVANALVCLVYLSIMMTTNWLPAWVFASGAETSMSANSRELASGNYANFLWRLNSIPMQKHLVQFLTTI